MSEDIDPIQAKRQAALAKLRARRGAPRQAIFVSRQEREQDRLSLITKAYKSLLSGEEEEVDETLLPPMDGDDESPESDHSFPPEVPLLGSDDLSATAGPSAETEFPRIAKVRNLVNLREKTAEEALAKWRTLIKNRRERQLNPDQEPGPVAGMPEQERRQMFFDLLTVDFLEHSRIWMSVSPDNVDLSTTPREEVEKVYEQALYRRKVLGQLEEMNDQELDVISAYLRAVKTDSSVPG